MKKSVLKMYKPSSVTRDSEFDNLFSNFKDLSKHTASMQSQFKNSRTSWGSVVANSKSACEAVDRAFANDEGSTAREFALKGTDALTEWDNQNRDLREANSDARFFEAEQMLAKYAGLIKTISKQVDNRNKICADLDYYRGKVEELSSKDMSKPKDKERFDRARDTETSRRQEFEQANNEVKIQLAKAVEQKQDIFMRCLAAFMDVNNRIMKRNPFDEVLKEYEYVLQGEWAAIDEYSPDFQPTYQAPISRAGSSTTNMVAPSAGGGGGSYVRALYDFVAQNPEELSFKAGDMIILLEVLDENWMNGAVNGREGIFPCNYVERT